MIIITEKKCRNIFTANSSVMDQRYSATTAAANASQFIVHY